MVLQKRRGETAAQCVRRYREMNPKMSDGAMTHVGRTDPMSEGVLLALLGDENNKRSNYAALAETYRMEVLFGIATDTFDSLGKITAFEPVVPLRRFAVEKALNEFRGKVGLSEPAITSKTVMGKSLVDWSRLFRPATLPKREATVYDIELKSWYQAPEAAVLSFVLEGIERVSGDFRQSDVRYLWKRYLSENGARKFPTATIELTVSAETPVRSIAAGIGEELGVPSLALRIVRTKVGDFEGPTPRVS